MDVLNLLCHEQMLQTVLVVMMHQTGHAGIVGSGGKLCVSGLHRWGNG